MPSPGSIGAGSIPVTDALTDIVPDGRPLVQVAAKAAARRDARMAAARELGEGGPPVISSQAATWPAATATISVAPAQGRIVYDIDGLPYPPAGSQVAATDVYAQRRLRDGSLVRITTTEG